MGLVRPALQRRSPDDVVLERDEPPIAGSSGRQGRGLTGETNEALTPRAHRRRGCDWEPLPVASQLWIGRDCWWRVGKPAGPKSIRGLGGGADLANATLLASFVDRSHDSSAVGEVAEELGAGYPAPALVKES